MFEQITGMVVGSFNVVFSPLALLAPIVSLLLVSIMVTVIVLLLNRVFISKEFVRTFKDKMEEVRENLTRAQKLGDKESISKHLNEFTKLNSEYMKHSFKATLVTLPIVLLFLVWLNAKYESFTISLPFTGAEVASIRLPLIGSELKAWLLWYILVSFTIGWVLRKLLGFD